MDERARIRRELLEALPAVTEVDKHETWTPGKFLTRDIVPVGDLLAIFDRICPEEQP